MLIAQFGGVVSDSPLSSAPAAAIQAIQDGMPPFLFQGYWASFDNVQTPIPKGGGVVSSEESGTVAYRKPLWATARIPKC